MFKVSLGAVSHAWIACSLLPALGALLLAAQSPLAAESRRAAAASAAATAGDTARVEGTPAAPAAVTAQAGPSSSRSMPAPVPATADSAKATAPVASPAAAAAAPAVPVSADSLKSAAPSAQAVPAPPDSALPATTEPTQAAPAAAAAVDSTATVDTAKAEARKKRKRVVRETTVNTIDELKGKYRSPKKALFMSLVVPGLGQAYVGQKWYNYARGAAYLLIDVGLAVGWHHYVVTKQDQQIRAYQNFADSNWRQARYEDVVSKNTDKDKFNNRFDHREQYCQSVQSQEGSKGSRLYQGCLNPADNASAYDEFKNENLDADWPVDSVTAHRKNFPNSHNFYELIGKEMEFVTGWLDANDIIVGDSSFFRKDKDGNNIPATTDLQQEYIGMRAQANDYARMQAWFLGGMVLNHIVSAVDAAFTAHVHNKSLYQTDVGMLERLHLGSYVAWDGYAPRPTVTATLTF